MSGPRPPGSWGAEPGPRGFGQSYQGQLPGYQQPWYPPPGPPHKGSGIKWIALAVVAVAAAAAVIVVVLHSNSGGNTKGSMTSGSAAASIASANDDGPVTVITEDPSCATWTPIYSTLSQITDQNGWDKRDPSIPAPAWTGEQRTLYQETATAMRHAADQTVAPAKLTPHRVMRELYEQLIAYWRAYADSTAAYTPIDDQLARVTTVAARAVGAICDSITHGSAASRGPLVAAPKPPTHPSPPGDPAKPERFLTSSNSICGDWKAEGDAFNSATADWRKIDTGIPAGQWTPEQRALNDAAGPLITASDDKFEQLGRRSGNPTLEDFAVLTAQYGDAFVQSLPTYVAADDYLYSLTNYSTGVVAAACRAVGS
jgi:hypothetical protein